MKVAYEAYLCNPVNKGITTEDVAFNNAELI